MKAELTWRQKKTAQKIHSQLDKDHRPTIWRRAVTAVSPNSWAYARMLAMSFDKRVDQ